MMLGEPEFVIQVESSVRPFRDVLLGLFFIGIGMLIDPAILPQIWHCLAGCAAYFAGAKPCWWRRWCEERIGSLARGLPGCCWAVGGEFGLRCWPIALDANVIDVHLGQIALTSVLFSMIAGHF